MRSDHHLHFCDSKNMGIVPSQSVHLVVTSPPYPMITMWDDLFCRQHRIDKAMISHDGTRAFELMHRTLDPVWNEVHRALVPGGIACINIGDATRTLKDTFVLYPNHTRISASMLSLGFTHLPTILWRKQTNAPNKFMGSGMMPPGAYVTLEHEYILIFRKGDRRLFNTPQQKTSRRQSAYFWEERNLWFSDVWMDLKGARQHTNTGHLRQRSAAYPFELAYRLISMFSVMGDTVLDPFFGTGTTLFAAAASGRNSIGFELDKAFQSMVRQGCKPALNQARSRIHERLDAHRQFIRDRQAAGNAVKYKNQVYGFPVVTRQEVELMLPLPTGIEEASPGHFRVNYEMPEPGADPSSPPVPSVAKKGKTGQLSLFDPYI